MRKRRKISKEEIVDDLIYFGLGAMLALIATFIFDIHWGLYEWPPKLKFIFKTPWPYVVSFFIGGVFGLIFIKLFLFALQENTFKKIRKILKRK